jgi:hypothetical protein
MHDQTYRVEPTAQCKNIRMHEHRPSEAWFPTYGLWRLKKMLKVYTLSFSCWRCCETDPWDLTFFHRVGLGLFTSTSRVTTFQSCCKMWIYRPGFTYGSCMMVLHAFSSCSLGILEQNVSGTVDGTMCTNSMACSFAWLRSFRFPFLRTPEVYCLCYRSQWRPALATANAE